MSSRPRLWAVPCALVVLAAGIAVADGSKTTKPAKPAAKSAKPGASKHASFAEIVTAFDRKEEEAQKALQVERWSAIESYVKANGTAEDAEPARRALVEIAEGLEDWARTVASADAYLGAHAASPANAGVRVSRAGALANLGKDADAKAGYEEVTKALSLEKDGVETCFSAWMAFADHLTAMGDLEGAKKAYESGKEQCQHPQVNQIMEQQLSNLEQIGTEATAFPDTAKDLDGKAVQVTDYKGKVLLIDFWATWCGPCVAEVPHVVEAYAKYHDRGLEILGITLDRAGDREKVEKFISSHGMPWPQVYYDEGKNEVAKTYGVNAIPHTVLLDREGKVVRIGLRGAALGRALERLLGAEKSAK